MGAGLADDKAKRTAHGDRRRPEAVEQEDSVPTYWKPAMRIAALAAAATIAALAPGQAEDEYPSRNITFVCAFPAGSGADVQVRFFADKLGAVIGKPIIVENKVGAAGNIAAQYTARSKPDGYTVFVHSGSTIAANMSLFKNPPLDVVKELRVAATTNTQAFLLTVRSDAPWKNVRELTEYLKTKGAKASYATTATPGKVMGALYKEATGIQAVEVPYRTGPDTVNDMTSGAVDYGMLDPVFALGQMRQGRFRILAVSTGQRMKSLPDIPTMTEQGVTMDEVIWWGAMVPAATPDAIVQKINGWFKEVVASDDAKKFLDSFGADPLITTPAEGQKLFVKAAEDWKKYVRIAKIPQN
jgi:tripartite-type tricarboxylate transporter receptor subunit TctC